MRNSKIDYALKKAKIVKQYEENQISNFSTYLNIVSRYLQKEYSDFDATEVEDIIFKDLEKIIKEFSDIGNLRGRYFELIAAREIVQDKEFIKKTAEEIKDKKIDEDSLYYTNNFNRNKKVYIKQIWKNHKDIDDKYIKRIEEFVEDTSKSKKIDPKTKSIQKRAKMFVGMPDEIIYENAKYQIPNIEKELKEEIIKIMEFLGDFFNKFNLLERYVTKHSSNMIGMDCLSLRYELSTNNFELDNIGAKELFSRKFLEKLNVDQLLVLNMFYQNRFSKEIATIGEAIFAIDTLNLWEDAKNNGLIQLDSEKINGLKNKMSCLDNISLRLVDEIMNQEKSKTNPLEDGYREVDISDKLDRIYKHNGKDYKDIFDKILPDSLNSLDRDLEIFKSIVNIRDNVYAMRERDFSTFLYSLIKQKSSKNFGIIRNEFVNGKFIDKLNSKYILLGIDYEGFNMPIRMHINKSNLIDVLNLAFGNSIIQEYEGAEDFVVANELISTSLLMPIPRSHKKAINEMYKKSKGKKNEKFISHIRFLKEPGMGKFPKHLMHAKNTPKGIKYIMKPKRYIDLQNGQKYILDENNNFIQHGGEIEFE